MTERSRQARQTRRGMAIVVVLTLSMALLIMSSAYISTLHNQAPVNPDLLSSIQAELMAQGATQIAMLKFKEMPSCLYYAAIASKSGNVTPYNLFRGSGAVSGDNKDGDWLMNASFTWPIHATCNTNFQMLSSQMYKEMNIRIITVVNYTALDGRTLSKSFEQTINGVRQKVGP